MFRSRSRATWGEFFFRGKEGSMWGDFSVERERKRKQLCHSVLFLFQLERAEDRQRHSEATQRRCADRSGQFLRPACLFLPGFAWGFVEQT